MNRKKMELSDMVVRLGREAKVYASKRHRAGQYWFTVTSSTTVRATDDGGAAVGILTKEAAWIGDKSRSYLDHGKVQMGIRLKRGDSEENTEWVKRIVSTLMEAE